MSRAAVGASVIAEKFGMTARYWTRMAAEGKIPGAWQPSGENGKWLFDVAVLAHWRQANLKKVKEWRGYTSADRRIGGAPSVRAENTASPSAPRINELLKSVCANG